MSEYTPATARSTTETLCTCWADAATVDLLAYPDHYVYRASDASEMRAKARERTLVVTEKDAVKLVAHTSLLGEARVLVQEVRWEVGREEIEAMLRRVDLGQHVLGRLLDERPARRQRFDVIGSRTWGMRCHRREEPTGLGDLPTRY